MKLSTSIFITLLYSCTFSQIKMNFTTVDANSNLNSYTKPIESIDSIVFDLKTNNMKIIYKNHSLENYNISELGPGGFEGQIVGNINSLNCNSITNSGTLNAGRTAQNVSFKIQYLGGNEGPYVGDTVLSKGITGLTAILKSGTFLNGTGNLIFNISGVPSGSGNAIFTINIAGKTCNISVAVKSPQQPSSGYGQTITDIDGNKYKTVYIGAQQWMAMDLYVTKFNDGTKIDKSNYFDEEYLMDTNSIRKNVLYDWHVLSNTYNGNRNVCPTDWHVPSSAEFEYLSNYLGGSSVAGGKLKQPGTKNWESPNKVSNSTLFNALPYGCKSSPASNNSYILSYWNCWSSTIDNSYSYMTTYSLMNQSEYLMKNSVVCKYFSIRCVKD